MNKSVVSQVRLSIGGIPFSLTKDRVEVFNQDDPFKAFITAQRPQVKLTVNNFINQDSFLNETKLLFNADGVWSLYQKEDKFILNTTSGYGVFSPDFTSGDVYLEEAQPGFFLSYPLDELLMVNLLSLGRGALFHACGVNYRGKGLLFLGASGAGKSTIARLWDKQEDVSVLSDDRIVLRPFNQGYKIYGTPWHGDACAYSSDSVVLDKIFFLNKAPSNNIKKKDFSDSVTSLLVYAFAPFWFKPGMKYTLDFCCELAQRVSIYDLEFLPEQSSIELIKKYCEA